MSCTICLRDDFTNYTGKDISWSYEGYSETQDGEYSKVGECWLEFDGVNDYAEARNVSDLGFALPVKLDFTPRTASASRDLVSKYYTSNSWMIGLNGGKIGAWIKGSDGRNLTPTIGTRSLYELTLDGSDLVQSIDGVEENRASAIYPTDENIKLVVGARAGSPPTRFYEMDLYSFQIGTEIFPLDEGSGATITGSEGTVLDIYGATWGCDEDLPDFDESCMDGPNPCFDSSELTPGYYKFTYTKDGDTGDVYLFIGSPEYAGNPGGDAFCYQGLPLGDDDKTVIDMEDYFTGATKYNVVYNGGELAQYTGSNLEISNLEVGQYCFTNMAEKELPDGFIAEECVDCDDYEEACITIVEPLSAGDNRVINVCNNVDEIYYQDYLVNNDGIGDFSILHDGLTAGSLDSEKYEPDLTDVGDSFTIVHTLPHPLASNCIGTAILEFNVVDCVPPPVCPDDSGLGMTITESTNGSPADAQWEDLLDIVKTGTYDDAGVIDTDKIYYSNDDGDNWTELTEVSGHYYVEDDDYYVKLTSAFDTNCNGGAMTGNHEVETVTLSNGADVNEAQLVSRNGNFNNSWTDIETTDKLQAAGSSASLIAERFFRWNVKHVLNSGWALYLLHTMFDRGASDGSCPNGSGAFGYHTYSGHVSGKRKILFERRITYTSDCDDIIIEGEFNPDLPECEETPSGVGFSITDPYKIGESEYTGSIECSGSISGSATDTMYVYEQPTGSNGYARTNFACGGSDYLYFNYSYFFVRIITFTDCPPVILTRNYGAPTSCSTATISCTKDDANSRAKANRVSTPANTATDYLQYRIGAGSWNAYTENQWVYVTGTTSVSFRRIANYNNGCSQTTDSCSTTVTPPSHSLSIACSGGDTITVSAVNMPPGGHYNLFRDGVVVYTGGGAPYPASQLGDYYVKYTYNQYQTITSNTVSCGSSGGCFEPTVSLGSCSISGNSIQVPFSTTGVAVIGDITASVTPGSGSFVWYSGSQTGTLSVTGTPGTTYEFEVEVENDCGTDTAYRTCTIGCSTLVIDNVSCNFEESRTYFSVYVSPDTGQTPTSTSGVYIGKSGNRYDFYQTGTSGTIEADHPQACDDVDHTISCSCDDPVISLTASCGLSQINYSFSVTNEQNAGDYRVKVNGNVVRTITNTGAGSYSGVYTAGQGTENDVVIETDNDCGGTETSSTVEADCGCNQPGINLSASCNTSGVVSYSFTVSNEAQTNGNYTVLINGASVDTITNTDSGSYSDTYTGTAGSTYTVQIRVPSLCGGNVNSNQLTTSCGCPTSSLSISDETCNSTSQAVSFTVNTTNATVTSKYLNGVEVMGSGPWTGVVGTNSILVNATDDCSGVPLSAYKSVTCGCTLLPTVQIDSMVEASGVLTVKYSTTNINSTGQIVFKGNNITRPISVDGTNMWKSTFPLNEGSNSVSVTVSNNCGNAMDMDTYSHSTCVAPSLTYVTEQCGNGFLYIYTNAQNITHADIDTTPASVRYGTPPNLTFRFPYGAGNSINWDIDGETDCGTVNIADTSSLCSEVDVVVVDEGCSATGCADYLFLIDNSGSIDAYEYENMKLSIQSTIDQIEASPVDAKYAILQYSTIDPHNAANADIEVSVNFTSSASTAKSFSREYPPVGNDYLNETFDILDGLIGTTVNPRSGCIKHLVIFTDARDGLTSVITPYTNRNILVNDGWTITVVKFPDDADSSSVLPKLASVATKGGSYNGVINYNVGDPQLNGKPRRLHTHSFNGGPVPGLVSGITENTCSLKAYIEGCIETGSFSWSTSGGTILSGAGTDTIFTDGTGQYFVTVTTNGCTPSDSYTY